MVYPNRVVLNINQKYVMPIPYTQQGDTARVLTFNILDKGVPFNLTGKTVRAKILKPDNTKCYNDLTITNATGGECDLKLTNQVLAVAGKVNCQLEIKEGEELLSTIIFPIDVEPSIDINGAVESTNEFTALLNGIIKLDEWDKYFKETSGAIEEKYTERLNGIDSSLEESKNKNEWLDMLNGKYYIAHRGFSGIAPENSIPSFEKAKEFGFAGVETDVVKTLDGEYVLMHDATVDRTTNGTGRVDSLTLEQIKDLNIDTGSNISIYNNLKVPTFKEFCECCVKNDLIPFIEIKFTVTEQDCVNIINILKNTGLVYKCIIIGYDLNNLKAFHNIDSKIVYSYIMDSFTSASLDLISEFKNTIIEIHKSQLTESNINTILSSGYKLGTYVPYQNEYFNYKLDKCTFITCDDLIGGDFNV